MPKKVLFSLPPAMLELVDFVARVEHRTRSDLLRECVRRYLDSFRRAQAGVPIKLVETTQQQPETANNGSL